MMTNQMMIGLLVLSGIRVLSAGPAHPQERPSHAPPAMTLANLQGILKETVENLKGESGQWRFTYAGVEMALLTSLPHDRMRIVAPIGPEVQLTDQQRRGCFRSFASDATDESARRSSWIYQIQI